MPETAPCNRPLATPFWSGACDSLPRPRAEPYTSGCSEVPSCLPPEALRKEKRDFPSQKEDSDEPTTVQVDRSRYRDTPGGGSPVRPPPKRPAARPRPTSGRPRGRGEDRARPDRKDHDRSQGRGGWGGAGRRHLAPLVPPPA